MAANQRRCVAGAESAEAYFVDKALADQLSKRLLERMLSANLDVPVRAQYQDARILDVAAQVQLQPQAGAISPVQVLQKKD
jgi:hypothetical protein